MFNGQPGRVVVSIQQPGTSADVSVVPGQHLGLSLIFRRATGATFTPTPLAFENMEATNASTAIGFASSLTLAF